MSLDHFARIDPYIGPLSIENAEAGIIALQLNATRLAHDSRLLLLARRNATAGMLAAMAIVELSRIPDILDLAVRDEGPRLKAAWRHLRGDRHPFPWAIFQSPALEIREDDLDAAVGLMMHVSQGVECVATGAWMSPDDLIGRPLAESLVNTAGLLCSQKIDLRAAMLWVEVLRSLPKSASNERALEAYRRALMSAGMNSEADKLEQLMISANSKRQ